MPDKTLSSHPPSKAGNRQEARLAGDTQGPSLAAKAVAFCQHHSPDLREVDILAYFFGVGRERLFHSDSLLETVDLEAMATLDDLLTARAHNTLLWLPEDARPDDEEFLAEARQSFTIELINWKPESPLAQRIRLSSVRHALHRLIEAMAYEEMRNLVADHPRRSERAVIEAVLPHLADLIDDYLAWLVPTHEGADKALIVHASTDHANPETEYTLTDPDAPDRLRLGELEGDLIKNVATTPFSIWRASVRQALTPSLREHIDAIIAANLTDLPARVADLSRYRSRMRSSFT